LDLLRRNGQSKFGRLFPELPAAKYGDTDEEEAKKLGRQEFRKEQLWT
jgi:hypothetical protein